MIKDPYEEKKKELSAKHTMWLSDPHTNFVLTQLRNRSENFKKTLQDNILMKSDEKEETKLRSARNTMNAALALLTDPELFVEKVFENKPNPTTVITDK